MEEVKKAIILILSLSLLLSIGIQTGNSSTTVSKSVTAQGQVSSGQVYWSAFFDNGNFNEIVNGGEVQTYPSSSNSGSVLESTNVFNGAYSANSSINNPPASGVVRSKLIRWNVMQDTPQFYFGAALYIPSTFSISPSANWCNIMQMHCKSDDASGLPACIILCNQSGMLKMYLYQKDSTGGENQYWIDNAPLNQWFRVVIYAEFKQNGNLTMWLSTSTTGALTDANKVHTGIHDLRTGDPTCDGAFIDTGIYQDYRSPRNYILSDSMIVASTLSLATPQG